MSTTGHNERASGFRQPAYWERPPELELTHAYWHDPHPEVEGMLSSDLILFYQRAIGAQGMISPFTRENLKPAAYELTLGPLALVDGKEKLLDYTDPWLELPPNSIVFVSMRETLILPHYIAARFDLAIEFVYQGILLGTGPQVDPGFQGVLSCPLHNISSAPVHIRLDYPFAKIDFSKTSGLNAAKDLLSVATEQELYSRVPELRGFEGEEIKLFNTRNRWREPIFSAAYAGQKRVRSSVREVDEEVARFRSEIRAFGEEIAKLRRFGIFGAIGAVIATIAVLVGLAQLDRSYTDARVDGTEQLARERSAELDGLERKVDALDARLRAVERRRR